jgi:hypothetical protein
LTACVHDSDSKSYSPYYPISPAIGPYATLLIERISELRSTELSIFVANLQRIILEEVGESRSADDDNDDGRILAVVLKAIEIVESQTKTTKTKTKEGRYDDDINSLPPSILKSACQPAATLLITRLSEEVDRSLLKGGVGILKKGQTFKTLMRMGHEIIIEGLKLELVDDNDDDDDNDADHEQSIRNRLLPTLQIVYDILLLPPQLN